MHRRMRGAQPRLSGPVEFFAQGAALILRLHHSPFLENRHDAVNKLFKRSRRHGVGDVEPIDSGLDPFLKFVGDLFRCPRHHWATATKADIFGQVAHPPLALRVGSGEIIPERANGVCFNIFERFVRVELTEIVAGPATPQGHRSVIARMFQVIVILLLDFRLRAAGDRFEIGKEENILRVASVLLCLFAGRLDGLPRNLRCRGSDKHALGVAGGKGLSTG